MKKFLLSDLVENNIKMDKNTYKKMIFINNAIEDGWSVKKNNDTYIFKKKHENKVEVFEKDYLDNFIINNIKN
jgi:hypothetical protein